jgi:hypothetical protein
MLPIRNTVIANKKQRLIFEEDALMEIVNRFGLVDVATHGIQICLSLWYSTCTYDMYCGRGGLIGRGGEGKVKGLVPS